MYNTITHEDYQAAEVAFMAAPSLPPGSCTHSGTYQKNSLSPRQISDTIYITGGNNNDPYQRAARPYRRSRGRI